MSQMGLMVNPPRPGDISYTQYAAERYTASSCFRLCLPELLNLSTMFAIAIACHVSDIAVYFPLNVSVFFRRCECQVWSWFSRFIPHLDV